MNRRKLFLLLFGAVILAVAGPFIAISADSSKPEQLVSTLDSASLSAKHYMTTYIDANGKVGPSSSDKLNFTHQAQALLITAADSDPDRFTAVWNRTKTDLAKPDGTYDASAADLLMASRAFLVAANRLNNADYRTNAQQFGNEAIKKVDGTQVLNAADFQLRTLDELAKLPNADPKFATIATRDRKFLQQRTTKLPADTDSPKARYGAMAQTIPLAIKDSCNASDYDINKALWLTLRTSRETRFASELDLDGGIANNSPSVKAAVATAAAASVAGEKLQSNQLLDQADALAKQQSNVDAAAWSAIGRIVVNTDWLGNC
jgi:hypothetical protein